MFCFPPDSNSSASPADLVFTPSRRFPELNKLPLKMLDGGRIRSPHYQLSGTYATCAWYTTLRRCHVYRLNDISIIQKTEVSEEGFLSNCFTFMFYNIFNIHCLIYFWRILSYVEINLINNKVNAVL